MLSLLAFCIAGVSFAGVTMVTDKASEVLVISDHEKVKINPEDLPAPVRTALANDTYAGWEIAAAYIVKKDNIEHYEVELTKGGETTTVKFDKDGNKK